MLNKIDFKSIALTGIPFLVLTISAFSNARTYFLTTIAVLIFFLLKTFKSDTSILNRNQTIPALWAGLLFMSLLIYLSNPLRTTGINDAVIASVGFFLFYGVAQFKKQTFSILKFMPNIFMGLALFTLAWACFGLFEAISFNEEVISTPWFKDSNISGALCISFALAAWGTAQSKVLRACSIATITGAALLITASKGVLLSVLLVSPVIIAFAAGKQIRNKQRVARIIATYVLVIPSIVFAIGLYFINSEIIKSENLTKTSQTSVISRASMINSTLEMIGEELKSNPSFLITGKGFNSWKEHYHKHRTELDLNSGGVRMHHDYLEMFYSTGLIYFGLFIALLWVTVYNLSLRGLKNNYFKGLASAFAFSVIFGNFNFYLIAPTAMVFYCYCIGVAHLVSKKSSMSNKLSTKLTFGAGAALSLITAPTALYMFLILHNTVEPLPLQTKKELGIKVTEYLASKGHMMATQSYSGYLEHLTVAEKNPETKTRLAEITVEFFLAQKELNPSCSDCYSKAAKVIYTNAGENDVTASKNFSKFAEKAVEENPSSYLSYEIASYLSLNKTRNPAVAAEDVKKCATFARIEQEARVCNLMADGLNAVKNN